MGRITLLQGLYGYCSLIIRHGHTSALREISILLSMGILIYNRMVAFAHGQTPESKHRSKREVHLPPYSNQLHFEAQSTRSIDARMPIYYCF